MALEEHSVYFTKGEKEFAVDIFDPKGVLILASIRASTSLFIVTSTLKYYESITEGYDELFIFLGGIYFQFCEATRLKGLDESYDTLLSLISSYNLNCIEVKQ